ncbi:MAG: hypothetical protein Kow0054_01540 [Deferrisoma sp.]
MNRFVRVLFALALAAAPLGLARAAGPSLPAPTSGAPKIPGLPPGVDVNRLLQQMQGGSGAVSAPAPREEPKRKAAVQKESPEEEFRAIVKEVLLTEMPDAEKRKELLTQALALGLTRAEAEKILEEVAEERAERIRAALADVRALREAGDLDEEARAWLLRKWMDLGDSQEEAEKLLEYAMERLHRLDVYRSVLETFRSDGVITATERTILEQRRTQLALTDEDHATVEAELEEEGPAPVLDVYERLRKEAESLQPAQAKLELYGKQLFAAGPDAFAPPALLPPPDDYRVGPGDRFHVTLWGRLEAEYDLVVDPEGRVQFPKVGPVSVAGLTYREARDALRTRAESITGVNAAVTLAATRSIQVFVVGEVEAPGAVTLSPLSQTVHAVMAAGGPTDLGSLRSVRLRRGGKVIATLDLYAFLRDGYAPGDRPLETGDVVVVPRATVLVEVTGVVKRPAIYELLPGEGLRAALDFAGGLRADAFGGRIQVERTEGHERRVVRDVTWGPGAPDFPLKDGDRVRAFPVPPEPENKVALYGHVYRPGTYAWKEGLRISGLLGSADRLKPRVDLEYGVILRDTGPDRVKEVVTFRPGRALEAAGTEEDPLLRPGDEVFLFSQDAFRPPHRATASGQVRKPGLYRIEPGARVADLVRLAGGLAPDALLSRAELLRYLPGRERQTLYVDLGAALAGNPDHNLELQDEDELVVHAVWDLGPEPVVFVEGEIQKAKNPENLTGKTAWDRFREWVESEQDRDGNPSQTGFGGLPTPRNRGRKPPEAIARKTEEGELGSVPVRLTRGMTVRDLVFKAGGLTKSAYLPVAHLYRTDPATKEITARTFDLGRALQGDPAHNLELQDLDHVVIHSAYDFQPLRPVVVGGMVTRPGEYPYAENLRVRDLILAAGGLKDEAYPDEAEIVRTEVPEGSDEAVTRTIRFSLEQAMAGDPEHNLPLRPYDKVFVKRIPEWRETWKVEVAGEVRFPGTYYVSKGEHLSSVLRRAGGYTPEAYLRGAVFTRESAREQQQRRLDELRDRLQQAILRASSAEVQAALTPEDVAAQKQYLAAQEQLLRKLEAARATGRVVVRFLPLEELEGSEWDIALEDGDTLTIPKRPQTVNVVGAVYNPTSLLWEPANRTVEHYLEKTGGPTPDAEEKEIYVVRADGTVVSSRSLAGGSWWSRDIEALELYPGDTVLVPEKVVRVSFMKELKDMTQILYQIAVTAGVAVALF